MQYLRVMDAEWFRERLRPGGGRSQAGLAKVLKVNPSQINRLLAGKRRLRVDELAKTAAYLDVTEDELIRRLGQEATPNVWKPTTTQLTGEQEFGDDDLPIYGQIQIRGDGGMKIQRVEAPEQTARPPILRNVSNAFAVRMPDSSMSPRYDAGDKLFVNPNIIPSPGRYAYIELTGGWAQVGRMERMDSETLVLALLSPAKELTFQRSDVKLICRIVGSQEG